MDTLTAGVAQTVECSQPTGLTIYLRDQVKALDRISPVRDDKE